MVNHAVKARIFQRAVWLPDIGLGHHDIALGLHKGAGVDLVHEIAITGSVCAAGSKIVLIVSDGVITGDTWSAPHALGQSALL